MLERLVLSRAGFLNFWYYDNQVFDFADGKLLLRGGNGSGKSVTMQSLVPVLLDGRTSADRLDPFGSRARRMEDYLLGEVSDQEERTAYLWLEFKRSESERYITCGVGLRARRHAPMQFWGFVITDNRRIGIDFELYKSEPSLEAGKRSIVPLSRRELTNRLQPGGKVVESRREYMELVNRHIFGFARVESYEELIKLLIQLRSPKLSKDFKPTVIYEILNESLPPLSEEELRPLSETIENMDQIQQQLEQLQRDEQAMQRLSAAYDNYGRYQLASIAKNVLAAADRCAKLAKKDAELASTSKDQELQKQAQEGELANLVLEQQALESERVELQEHDVFAIEKRYLALEQEQLRLREQEAGKQKELVRRERREREIVEQLREQDERLFRLQGESEYLVEELDELAELAAFAGHRPLLEHWQRWREGDAYSIEQWQAEAQEHGARLQAVLQALGEHTQANAQHNASDRAHAEAVRELDVKQREQEQLIAAQDRGKEEYLVALDAWWQQAQEIRLTPAERQLVAKRLYDIFEPHLPAAVLEPVTTAWERAGDAIRQEITRAGSRLQQKEEQIETLELEITAWQQRREPEPLRHQDTETTRQALRAAGVPHLPFYEAVEFQPHVSLELRERVESAISELGVLDALIVSESDLGRVSGYDKVIRPNPQLFAHTLTSFLQPVPSELIDAVTIENVLLSILWGHPQADANHTTTVLAADGRYRMALLTGQAPREEAARYIGREARRQHHARELAKLQQALEVLTAERGVLQADVAAAEARLACAKQEFATLPALTALETRWRSLSGIEEQLRVRRDEVALKQQQLTSDYNQLLAARRRLHQVSLGLNFEVTEAAYKQAVSDMQTYTARLHSLELQWQASIHGHSLLRQLQLQLEDVQVDIDLFKGELNILASDLRLKAAELSNIERRLLELNVEEIRDRIRAVELRLQQIPLLRDQANRDISRLEAGITNNQREREGLVTQIELAGQLEQGWQQLFATEITCGYAPESTATDLRVRAREVQRGLGQMLQQVDRNRPLERLTDSFYRETALLVEYRPVLEEQAVEILLPQVEDDAATQAYLAELKEHSRRKRLVLEYLGRKADIAQVLKSLQQDILIQVQLLGEKDRELYEEIILHSVGDMIRKYIQRAEHWVQMISQLMEQRNSSSGLTFSLLWRPRTAETERELDVKELVELLRLDPSLLKESDLQQVTEHFRSQIERAKAEVAERQRGEAFQAIVQELLDYRRWFDFKLLYRREGEQKRELTDRVFFTFSGGEKAMAMYIPLFSAAYARYQDAREDTPRLITLDEAFAGVDETNIKDMFALMEQLGFNYIINSQALWGDYDTAGRLAISELVRPKNAPYVTVVPYLWDGQSRQLQLEPVADNGGAN